MVDQLVPHRKATWAQFILHSTSATLLTLLSGFLGAPFLRVLRQSQGAAKYWLAGLFFVVGFWFLGAIIVASFVGSVWVTLGLYSEFERRGYGWWTSGLIGTFAGFLFGAAGSAVVLQQQGVKNWESFVGVIRESLEMVQQFSPEMKLDPGLIASQTPSILVVLLLLSLGTGLAFEAKLFAWTGLARERVASHIRLLEFRLPDFLIWMALTGLLLAMVDFGSKPLSVVGVNVVNISLVLYFFQGLAVLEVLLNALKAGTFTRIVVYFFLVGQLFFVLSAVGLIDYWADFRKRISKPEMPAPEKKLRE